MCVYSACLSVGDVAAWMTRACACVCVCAFARVFSELSMKRGDTFYMIYKRPEDGWCLVRTPSTIPGGAVEGWVPGNFISKDGKRALVETKR